MKRLQRRVHTLLEPGEAGDAASRAVDLAIIALVLANALAAALETVPGFAARHATALWRFEVVSIAVFTAEYVARVWSCTAGTGVSPVRGRLRHMLTPLLLIDLAAILPFYLGALGLDLRVARLARLARFIRLAKLGRYSTAARMLGEGIRSRKEELLLTAVVAAAGIVVAATLMYYAEHAAQPESFPSIPAALWWAVTTLTTVGYGDTFPVTLAGRLIGGFVQVLGVGLVALPAGILAGAFQEQVQARRAAAAPRTCPHCGRVIEE